LYNSVEVVVCPVIRFADEQKRRDSTASDLADDVAMAPQSGGPNDEVAVRQLQPMASIEMKDLVAGPDRAASNAHCARSLKFLKVIKLIHRASYKQIPI
jgi:hypothetical protein